MKRRIVIISVIFILVIMGIFLIIGLTNKTFFKSYYEVANRARNVKIPLPLFSYYEEEHGKYKATFSTLRSVKSIQDILNKYVEHLHACYDEGYFYDSNLDITISRYYIENGFPFNKIYLVYDYGNYCENEFVLDDNWKTEIIENAKVQEANINKCVIENDNRNCSNKAINETDIRELFNYISQENVTRVESKKNIGINETDNYYSISGYYVIDGKGYMLSIFIYNNYLAFKVTDANDHSKNAIYDVGGDDNKILGDIYDRY